MLRVNAKASLLISTLVEHLSISSGLFLLHRSTVQLFKLLQGDKGNLGLKVVLEESLVQESPSGVLLVPNLGPPFLQPPVLEQSVRSSFLEDLQ